ncbi:serine--tRNA ligase-like [Panonychus citri]|uniref:serine--tRNA ligase-like n=1 Tax=Panonychus citri TaxID=50023 RepID=UPI00230820C2|nr:serine--tRNA ligase-like [Panonychus citri]
MALFRTSNLPKGHIFPVRVIVNLDEYLVDDYVKRIEESISIRSSPEEAKSQVDRLKSYQPLMRKILELRPKRENLVTFMGTIEDNLGDTNSYFTNVRPDLSHLTKDLENIEQELRPLEDEVISFLLKLPNEIDEDTERSDGQYFTVIEEVTKPRPKFKLLDSVKLAYINFGQHTSIIGPASQFITADGAKLFIALTRYFSSSLLSADYIPFVGLDIVKSAIIQACDAERVDNIYNDPLLIAQGDDAEAVNNYIHLVGESAFEAFAGLLNRREINPSRLPLRFSSIGSNYSSTLNQYHTVNCVTLTPNEPKISAQETQSMVSFAWSLYKDLGLPCRLVKCSGQMLKANESSRYEIQVWMPSSSTWKASGHVANHRDYTTKRLGREGYSIVKGTLVNCDVLVASLMENNQQEDGTFKIPDLLEQQLVPKSF